MQAGDKVYYLYTDKYDNATKFAAVVISVEDDGILVRVGKFDVLLHEIKTFDSIVPAQKLSPRKTNCSFENELEITD